MEEQEKVACIEQGLRSTFWTEFLYPLLRDRCGTELENLANASSEKDDERRGWYKALKWVINTPQQIVEDFSRVEEAQTKLNEADEDDKFRAERGFRSPISRMPEPGELTDDEAQDASAGGSE